MRVPRLALTGTLALALALVIACDDDEAPNQPPPPEGVVPDFALLDVNPNSGTFDQNVSPRQQMGKISAWYFGAAT
jgi:hypothetical protein